MPADWHYSALVLNTETSTAVRAETSEKDAASLAKCDIGQVLVSGVRHYNCIVDGRQNCQVSLNGSYEKHGRKGRAQTPRWQD